jgi:hypothetical protein
MKRFPFAGTLLLVPAFALVFLVGCPGPQAPKDKDKGTVKSDDKTGDKGKGKSTDVEITAPTEGVIKGVVSFKGDAPKHEILKAILEHKEKDFCVKGGGKHVQDQTWIINNGKVENVVITLGAPSGKKFKITEELKKPFMDHAVFMDQPYCAYVPHVAAIYADIQKFGVLNSAEVLHNVKITPAKNPSSDDSVPPKTTDKSKVKTRTYEKEGPINISCSIHGFMNAKLLTFDHPYFAVTKEDGSFEIKNVPVGEEVTIYMWHESNPKHVEAQKITVKKGDNPVELSIGAGK